MVSRYGSDAGRFAVFTICAPNYLAQAAVLGASVREHHPDLTLIVFLLEPLPAGFSAPDGVEIIEAERTMPRREWNHRRAHYDLLEFATSVKPACFRHLFDHGARRAIYLDPDIRLFGRLDRFWHGGDDDPALVLTPHLLTPLPRDGRFPDDLTILRAGTYNLGFAALRDTPRTRDLLTWWDARLHDLCLQDVRHGVFTDQRWIDLAPAFVPDHVLLMDPGYNLAYWNLHERTPRRVAGEWHVSGPDGLGPLVFAHFSGFSPDSPGISKHENRFGHNPPGEAAALYAAYAQALLAADHRTWATIVPSRPSMPGGLDWDMACRALYRETIARKIDVGDPLVDPHFLAFATSNGPADHVPRYLRTILTLRGDAAATYDDGHDRSGLMAWLRGPGIAELGLNPTLIERCAEARSTEASGVTFVGYLSAHLGVGEAARQSVAALQAAGVRVHTHDISDQAGVPTGFYAQPGAPIGGGAPPITILGCNADMLPTVLSTLPAPLRDGYRIGYWYWETQDFPEHWADRFDMVDEVWVATQFVAEAIRAKATVPVVVMPPMIAPPRIPRDRAWLSRLVPEIGVDEFVFLFQFDVASVVFRKNPEGAIDAFLRAFAPDEPVRLIVKLLNASADPGLIDRLRERARGGRVSLVDATLESEDRFRLIASVDGFVSLHRSEGFGLSIAEAMAHGLPVVATGWSGNADFTRMDTAAVVPFTLLSSDVAHGPYPAGTLWAEPDLDAAARLMRRVWTDRDWRETLGRAAAAMIARECSAATVGGAMRERLRRIEASARMAARRQAARHARLAAEHNRHGSRRSKTRQRIKKLGKRLKRLLDSLVSGLPRLRRSRGSLRAPGNRTHPHGR